MRSIFTAAIISLTAVGGACAQQPATAPAAPAAASAPKPIEAFTTMRDGVKLAADVYLPQGQGPWPVIVSRTPYGKQNMFAAGGGRKFVDAGYAYVVQDVRG